MLYIIIISKHQKTQMIVLIYCFNRIRSEYYIFIYYLRLYVTLTYTLRVSTLQGMIHYIQGYLYKTR